MVNAGNVELRFQGSGMTSKLNKTGNIISAATILIGFGGMIGQLLLIRVLMVLFYGNELSISLVIANWLLMEGLGSYFGGKLTNLKIIKSKNLFFVLFMIYPFSLIGAIILARLMSGGFIITTIPGLAMNLSQMLVTTILTIGITSIIHGSLFPLAAKLFEEENKDQAVSRAYLVEIIGTILGGLLFVFLFAWQFKAIETAFIIFILHLIIILLLINNFRLYKFEKPFKMAFILFIFIAIILFNPITDNLHEFSLSRLWPEGEVIDYRNSIYGNIVTLSREGEKTVLYDGNPVANLTNPEISWSEDYSYLTATAHENPENILMIGHGIGGPISFLLEHPVTNLTYTELDPQLLDILREADSEIIKKEFDDPRVNIVEQDGRLYLNQTKDRYDIIKIGDIDTETLQTNRFYTEELFELASRRLKEDGMLVFSLPGSYTYMAGELALINSSLYKTANNVFANSVLIPGDRNIIIASDKNIEISPDIFVERLKERDLYGRRFTTGYLEFRLDESRIENLTEKLILTTANINRDFNPAGFYYGMLNRISIIAPGYTNFFNIINNYRFEIIGIAGVVLVLIYWLLFFKSKNNEANRLTYLIATTGSIAMSFDILIMFALQSLFGHIYQFSGLFIVAFMGGMFAGGRLTYKRIKSKREEKSSYILDYLKKLEIGIIGMLLLFVIIVNLLREIMLLDGSLYLSAVICIILAILAGGVTGAQFPLGTELLPLIKDAESAGSTAGRLYTADLLGGWLAGLIIGILIFPVAGLVITILSLIVIKVSSILLIYKVLPE